jgi:YggT family protein
VLQFLTGQVVMAGNAITNGPTGVLILVVHWTFALLQFALLFRVISSWIAVSPYSRWVRWSYVLTEWFLRPLRRVIPTVGMFDITPIIAYFGLILLERLVLGAL